MRLCRGLESADLSGVAPKIIDAPTPASHRRATGVWLAPASASTLTMARMQALMKRADAGHDQVKRGGRGAHRFFHEMMHVGAVIAARMPAGTVARVSTLLSKRQDDKRNDKAGMTGCAPKARGALLSLVAGRLIDQPGPERSDRRMQRG